MDSAFIHQAANELVQNAGTRNIKQIARSCSLDISETSRIKDMLGLLSLYFDKPLILINRQLDKQTKQMVCGYALGHYLEHQLLMDLHTLNKFLTISVNLASATLMESPIEIIKDHAVFQPSVLKRTRYLIAFLGIFIFVGCVAVGAVFVDSCNKKETARKNPTVSRQFYCTGDIIRIIPISCKKAAVSQSDSPTQRPFRFWLRLTTSVHRRPCVPRRPPAP